MGTLFSYSLAVGIVLAVLYIVYRWLLTSEKQPRLNRVALMSIYVVSFILPFLPHFESVFEMSGESSKNTIEIGVPQAQFLQTEDPGLNGLTILLWVYASGILFFLIKTVITVIRLYVLVKRGSKEYFDDYVLVRIDRDDIAPFSWGKYVVMNRNEEDLSVLLIQTHELTHIKSRHYIDLIISQLTCIMLWYNPASWLMQTELKAVHEYEADDNVLRSGYNAREYQLLLVKKAVGQRFPSLANSLNHSKLNKRITMMYSKKTSAARKTRVLALVPAAVLGFGLLNVPTVGEAMATASVANMSIGSVSENKVTTKSSAEQTATDDVVVAEAEKAPEFEGGLQALMSFLIENVKYPDDAKDANVQGRVIVSFTITKNGEVKDLTVNKSINPSLDAEALRVVQLTSGKWIPGEIKGEKVNVTYTLPIAFKTK